MAESTAGAGPALAAHSKDASAPGQNPASEMTGETRFSNVSGESLVQQAADFVRRQPLGSMGGFIVAGIVAAKLLRRR
jgi:hypothetical protein